MQLLGNAQPSSSSSPAAVFFPIRCPNAHWNLKTRPTHIVSISTSRPLQINQVNCTRPKIAETKDSPIHSSCRCLTPPFTRRPCHTHQTLPTHLSPPVPSP